MKAAKFCCLHCRRKHRTTKIGQRYCGHEDCQSARKRKWSRGKYADDPDYRLNQKESTSSWLKSRGGAAQYYRDYRRQKREHRLTLRESGDASTALTQRESSAKKAITGQPERFSQTNEREPPYIPLKDSQCVENWDRPQAAFDAVEQAAQATYIEEHVPLFASRFAADEVPWGASANSDAGFQYNLIKTGIYRIFPVGANKDAVMAEIRLISSG